MLHRIVGLDGVISATFERDCMIVITRTSALPRDRAFVESLRCAVATESHEKVEVLRFGGQRDAGGSASDAPGHKPTVFDGIKSLDQATGCSDRPPACKEPQYLDDLEGPSAPMISVGGTAVPWSFFSHTNWMRCRRLEIADDPDVAERLATVKSVKVEERREQPSTKRWFPSFRGEPSH